ncbi:hypothetical protein [Thermosporothrix hazakensis]|jgi:hypothetical protein|uniref:Uncharacterized protein n=1 Tax=Thermosporothrix sp. COM3 TaxID=2490863 RepID=A0A455SXR3_9CHLR|nr:hypothetical protein [Thermosporothrix hazakensis]BBH91692.1 hypothetical protein KTC_64430 [Thermosporothrix sp. COM3]GCE49824.1 hypothetical protein KTH_46930 [Thermosporothrix hazakensis]
MNTKNNQGNLVELNISGTQALLVILVYGILFLAISLLLTWKKDIKE